MIDLARFGTIDLVDRWTSITATRSDEKPDKRDKFYQGSYRYILSHIATCCFDETQEDCERFWQSLILVYSWMGRGLLYNFDDPFGRYRDACDSLRAARDGKDISEFQLKPLMGICQESVVGLSKLLHFVAPTRFAIWDQWVANAVFDKAHRYQVNDLSIYLAYLEWIRSAPIDEPTLNEVCKRLQLDPFAPSLRPKEFILFTGGRLARTAQSQTLADSAS